MGLAVSSPCTLGWCLRAACGVLLSDPGRAMPGLGVDSGGSAGRFGTSHNPNINSGYAKFGACAAARLPVTAASIPWSAECLYAPPSSSHLLRKVPESGAIFHLMG